jgi:putative ATP-dependent endonuclease of OLD family
MTRIRKLSIRNFRSIQSLDWTPSPGINCLVGPGDSGKSSILDAIDLCLGARRNAPFGDTDFHNLNVSVPIEISITLGELSDDLMNIEVYGDHLQGFNSQTNSIEEEPGNGLETVLTLQLRVESDLEPEWNLHSARAEEHGHVRNLKWKDRTTLAPARIGAYAHSNLSWSRNSVLNRLTEDTPDLGAELAKASRQARNSFGQEAAASLTDTLRVVKETAAQLGVPVGDSVQALLDAHTVSIGDGAIALHNENGVPLRSLGTGSSRLLVAGLQRVAASKAAIALVDEVEYGLEPHRLIRFLDSLGAKEKEEPPLQAFITTHSPVALRELDGDQIFIVRSSQGQHTVRIAGTSNDIQGTLRVAPDAFLGKFVLVCEGASEVGFVRGMDIYGVENQNEMSLYAAGGAFINVGGGSPDNCFIRGVELLKLGYHAIVVVDADKQAKQGNIDIFLELGGQYVTWQKGHALEDELFATLGDAAIDQMLVIAKERFPANLLAQHIQSKSNNRHSLADIEASRAAGAPYSDEVRALLALASKNETNSWFKTLSTYQKVAKEAVFPHLDQSKQEFRDVVTQLKGYINAAGD